MMAEQLREAIQRIAVSAIAADSPSDYCIGIVETADPLSIRIEQQELLTEDFFLLTDMVRDYVVDITVSHTTENKSGGTGDASFESHNHDYTGRKKIIVHNGLVPGEAVILIRQAGGQEYIVLCRVGAHQQVIGQWG